MRDPLQGRLVPMQVKTLLLDPAQNTPVLILQESGAEDEPGSEDGIEDLASAGEEGRRILPIWIGLFEASAIQMQLEGTEPPRPLTHDLMADLLESLDVQLIAVVIHSLEEGTFYASLRLQQGDELFDVDARPSDAVALALRADAELFVGEQVFAALTSRPEPETRRDEELKRWFENLDPDDLGKYTM
ncbi:MAG: bifunctional nuclease family protein [Acidobacteria bacterium]|nr:MAG: bifunctional nuclease family protein [Acidobacteriota bacterium]REK10374.1 MAG: bifunctional nuclease family protein [Acidobacteriota bacterium]